MNRSLINKFLPPLRVENSLKIALPQAAVGAVAVMLVLSAYTTAELRQQDATQQPEHPATASVPAPSEATGAAPLRVMVGKSLLINTSERLKRVSVTDPAVADVQVVTPTQILVTPSRSAIVLSGHVSDETVATRAGKIAEAYSKNVVNVLTFGPKGAQEVLLEVKFAEVDRTAILQYGFNLFDAGQGNTIGTIQTGQFGSVSIHNTATTTTTNGSTSTTTTTATPPTVNISDFLNVFITRTDLNIGAVIKALQAKNLLQILAEPNLIAVNGKEASFLAGGEFPFPIVQPSQGFNAVTIQFKEFGVKLRFTPVIMPSGNIHLKVVPEVSTLDFTNALQISGFLIPALSTRRADTEFELQDGQSFVIAGLMDNRVTNLVNKIPGLGDIPILGTFFKSKSTQRSNAELMVLCTVKKVGPAVKPTALPNNPEPFLNNDKFDGKKPGGGK